MKKNIFFISASIIFLFVEILGGAQELKLPDVILPRTEQGDVPQPSVYPDPSSGWQLKKPKYRRIYQMEIELSQPSAPFRTLFPYRTEDLLKKIGQIEDGILSIN